MDVTFLSDNPGDKIIIRGININKVGKFDKIIIFQSEDTEIRLISEETGRLLSISLLPEGLHVLSSTIAGDDVKIHDISAEKIY